MKYHDFKDLYLRFDEVFFGVPGGLARNYIEFIEVGEQKSRLLIRPKQGRNCDIERYDLETPLRYP